MRLLIFTLFLIFSAQWMQAQDNPNEADIGDFLVLASDDGNAYQHVHFPKLNFILKAGGIGNWSSIRGTKVVVTDKYQNSQGETFVVLERADDLRFFKVIRSVSSSLDQALAKGELKRL
jgi:hypothetical protein